MLNRRMREFSHLSPLAAGLSHMTELSRTLMRSWPRTISQQVVPADAGTHNPSPHPSPNGRGSPPPMSLRLNPISHLGVEAENVATTPRLRPVPFAKIFPFPPDPNHFYIPRRLVPSEGRIAIVTDAGRDAVDAGGALDESRRRGRRSRVVLTPRRRRQVCEKKRRRR